MKRFLAEFSLVIASIAAALLLVMAGLYLAGYPAHRVMADWAAGAFLERFDIAVGLKNACPLILTGLCAGIAFRSGVINIGGEGQVLLGSLGALTLSVLILPTAPAAIGIPLALLAAAFAGAMWALVAALLDRFRGVPVVLSTILLNFIALKLLETLLQWNGGPLKDPTTGVPISKPLPIAFHLPMVPTMPSLHVGIFIALAVALVSWVIQSRTAFGFELRVTGLNPVAAKLAGIAVDSRRLWVMLLSGAFAGIAGALQFMGVTHVLGTTSPGIGYAGVAVALLGRLHPLGIILAALFFGMLDQGATNVEIGQYEIPHDVSDIVKGIIVLGILVGTVFISRRRTVARER